MGKNVKKVGIIYNGNVGADWAIDSFKKEFEDKNIPVYLFDVNNLGDIYSKRMDPEEVNLPEFERLTGEGYTVWMNRVYPSEGDQVLINKGLNATAWLSARNYTMINPLPACIADYDKKFAHDIMKKWNVNTPKTEILDENMDVDYLREEFGFPLIIKINTGGKGLGVQRVNNENQLESVLKEDVLRGDHLVQKFLKPSLDHDVRIGVINGEPLISYGRTLANNGEKDAWMGSCHHGSKIIDYQATEDQLRLAVLSSKALGAILNEVDMHITEEGPVIIENNLTPGYDVGEERWVRLIVDHIYKKHIK